MLLSKEVFLQDIYTLTPDLKFRLVFFRGLFKDILLNSEIITNGASQGHVRSILFLFEGMQSAVFVKL
jgi:hypothetical protein